MNGKYKKDYYKVEDDPNKVGERMKKKLCGEIKEDVKKNTLCKDCRERF